MYMYMHIVQGILLQSYMYMYLLCYFIVIFQLCLWTYPGEGDNTSQLLILHM